jgi:hypothetical protein
MSIMLPTPKKIKVDNRVLWLVAMADPKIEVQCNRRGWAIEQFMAKVKKETGLNVVASEGTRFHSLVAREGAIHLYVERVFENGKWRPDRFVMKGKTGEHAIKYKATNAERLRSHWAGFCENNGVSGPVSLAWDKKHFYL